MPTDSDHPSLRALGEGDVARLRAELSQHEVYASLNDLDAWRAFMGIHVFAVWDFMVLLKALQGRLTGNGLLWTPPLDRTAARMINEIVLSEESDEVRAGVFMSHLELYREGMQQVGVPGQDPFQTFLDWVGAGSSVEAALSGAGTPECVRDFVRTTMRLATAPVHRAAAAFLYGREEVIPEMFAPMLRELDEAGVDAPSLRQYLTRHQELDGGAHSQMGRQLLATLCGDDPHLWEEAKAAAQDSLEARKRLWSGALAHILEQREPEEAS